MLIIAIIVLAVLIALGIASNMEIASAEKYMLERAEYRQNLIDNRDNPTRS